ncbi:PPE domain-containing protein [Crossiella sp. CA-258035]|uniref:PPE domain-containing protein n=1 Tax=Crossiella sp. CA-258035 TaxID=2981138 RepID=UPI0024BC0A96|nr:PPE domain-containing protein [Crossiella sp. CA-258035]WHT17256.1 PPE domain-containing protein [Crossiella sp. CA-258035]
MSEEPRIRHNRFEGYPLEEKYQWMQEGAGSGAVLEPADALRAMHVAAEECRERVARALTDLGLDWHGAAASAMFDAARPSLHWAMTALKAAETNLAGVSAHGVDFAETKPKIESAEQVRQPGFVDTAFNPLALIEIQQDMHTQLAANKARDDAANRALYAFEAAARAQAESVPTLPDPPRIAVQTTPVAPPPPGDRREPPPADPPTRDPGRTRPPGTPLDQPANPGRPPGPATTEPITTEPITTEPITTEPVAHPGPGHSPGPEDGTRAQAAPTGLRPDLPVPDGSGTGFGGPGQGGGSGVGLGGPGPGGGYGGPGPAAGSGGTAGFLGALGGGGASPQPPPPASRNPASTGRGTTHPAAGKPGAPGPSLLPPAHPGRRPEDDVEHTSKVRRLSDEIYGLDDLPTVPPPVIGEEPS